MRETYANRQHSEIERKKEGRGRGGHTHSQSTTTPFQKSRQPARHSGGQEKSGESEENLAR